MPVKVTVYLDIILFLNVVMNFFILSVTSFIIKKTATFKRLIISSVFGAVLYCITIYILNFYYYSNIIFCFIIMLAMTTICFNCNSLKDCIKNCIFTYFTAIVTGGICFNFFYSLKLRSPSFLLIFISSFSFYLIVKIFTQYVDTHLIDRKKYCDIAVSLNGSTYKLTALIDTGAFISDLKNGDKVILAERKIFKNIDGCQTTQIPFISLGQTKGMITAVYGQQAIINKKTIKPIVIGLYNDKLSESFNAIISPEVIGGNFNETI